MLQRRSYQQYVRLNALRFVVRRPGFRVATAGEPGTNTVRLFLTCHDELRGPQQGTFDLGIGELADRLPCGLSVLRRKNMGRFYRAVSRQNVENIGVGYAIECPVLQ